MLCRVAEEQTPGPKPQIASTRGEEKLPDGKKSQEEPGNREGAYPPLAGRCNGK